MFIMDYLLTTVSLLYAWDVCVYFVSANVLYTNYGLARNRKIPDSRTKSQAIKVRSKIECSIRCSTEADCCTANYRAATNICQMESNCCPEYFFEIGVDAIQKQPMKDLSRSPPDKPKDCNHLPTDSPPGIYTIYPDSVNGFNVSCKDGWTVFQRNTDGGNIRFNRNWNEYKVGFGDPKSDHWLGNDKLSILTSNGGKCGRMLKIVLSDFEGTSGSAVFQVFHVWDEVSKYRLFNGGYKGDSLWDLNGKSFSAYDQDNDIYPGYNCAQNRQAGWWFGRCGNSNLNGPIREGVDTYRAMIWYSWRRTSCLKTSLMMLK